MTFGEPLTKRGNIREWIAESRIDLEMARLLVLKTAWLMDTVGNQHARTEIAAIKVAVPQIALKIVDRAIQVHGGGGCQRRLPARLHVRGVALAAPGRRPRRGAQAVGGAPGAAPPAREAGRVSVDPTGADLKRFMQEDPGGPVVMLNLLRFAEGGRSSYDEYARQIVPFLDRLEAEVLYFGDCSTVLVAPDSHRWDAVLVVRYPSREAFSRMVADPEYQQITHLRSEGLEEAVLQATVPLA